MQRGVLAVLIAPRSRDAEGDFLRWYEQVHFPEVLAIAGFVSGTLYRAEGGQLPAPLDATPYLALYEVEAETMELARANMEQAVPSFRATSAFQTDPGPLSLWFEEVLPRREFPERAASSDIDPR
jgi:hypothetical protein